MRLKPFVIAARLTPGQYEKLSTVADVNGLTVSSAVGVLVDALPEGKDLFTPLDDRPSNANGAGVDLPVTSAIAA